MKKIAVLFLGLIGFASMAQTNYFSQSKGPVSQEKSQIKATAFSSFSLDFELLQNDLLNEGISSMKLPISDNEIVEGDFHENTLIPQRLKDNY